MNRPNQLHLQVFLLRNVTHFQFNEHYHRNCKQKFNQHLFAILRHKRREGVKERLIKLINKLYLEHLR